MTKLVARAIATITTGMGLGLAAASPAFAVPNPKPNLPGNVQNKVNLLLGMGMAVVIAACVAGVFICAGKLAMAIRRGEGAEAAGQLVGVGVACVLVGSAAGIVTYLSA